MGGGPPRLFLFDGYALAYRAFYALIGRPLRTSKGENTSVPYGVARVLRKVLLEHHPEHLAFVIDAPGGSAARRARYPPYKGTREKLAEADAGDFLHALARMRQVLAALRIPLLEIPGAEADDVIATLARQAVAQGVDVVIVSGDTDFYQLIGPHVRVLEPGRGGRAMIEPRLMEEDDVIERMGVPPGRVVEYLALVGDASDNVPGVHGIGHKTAVSLLQRFGTLEEVLHHVEDVKPARAKNALLAERDRARLSRELVVLDEHVPVRLELPALAAREPDQEKLRALFLELEFHSLLHDLAPPREAPQGPLDLRRDDVQASLESRARREGVVALAWELDDDNSRVRGLALAAPSGEPAYLTLATEDEEDGSVVFLPDPLRALLEDDRVAKLGHDLKEGAVPLRRSGAVLRGPLVDTMLLSFCLDPSRRAHDLEPLAVERLGARFAASEPRALASERADAILRLAPLLRRELEETGAHRVYDDVDGPLLSVLIDLEAREVPVDEGSLERLGQRLDDADREVLERAYTLAGGAFDPSSPADLRRVLYEQLGLPVKKRKKTGPSVDAEVLSSLADDGEEIAARVLEHRSLARLKRTYVEGLLACRDERTGRARLRFRQAQNAEGLETVPDLTGLPANSPTGRAVREAVKAPPGSVVLVGGLESLELRLLAHFTRDDELVRVCREDDAPAAVARRLFGGRRPSAAERALAVTVSHAALYGEVPADVADAGDVDVSTAETLLGRWFDVFPSVKAWLSDEVRAARERGFVESFCGRRRPLPELRAPNRWVRAWGERLAQRARVTGSAADVRKLALLRVTRRLDRTSPDGGAPLASVLLPLHDVIVLEARREHEAAARAVVERALSTLVELRVPLRVVTGSGSTWLEAARSRERPPPKGGVETPAPPPGR